MSKSTLTDMIAARAERGQLALGLYLVPGFPDWPTSTAALATAVRLGVTFVEHPIILEPDWSPRTGSTVARALARHLDDAPDEIALSAWLESAPMRVGVVYHSAWPAPAVVRAPDWQLAGAAALLLEMSTDDVAGYAATAHGWGLPLVAAIDATTGELTDAERCALAVGGGFVYAALGPRTGAAARSCPDLAKAAAVRQTRPDLPLCAAFGIGEREQVRTLRTARACAGVIAGTAALEALEQGLDAFTDWLSGLIAAASSTREESPS